MDEHQGSAPGIPVWKTGVYLSTPMLEEMACQSKPCRLEVSPPSLKLRRATFARRGAEGEGWNPVLESHQPLRFCKPPPELLGQRDERVNLLILEPGQTRRNSPSSRLKSCYSDSLRNFWSHSASAGSSTIAQEW